jgi:hypothetical protein
MYLHPPSIGPAGPAVERRRTFARLSAESRGEDAGVRDARDKCTGACRGGSDSPSASTPERLTDAIGD